MQVFVLTDAENHFLGCFTDRGAALDKVSKQGYKSARFKPNTGMLSIIVDGRSTPDYFLTVFDVPV